MPKPTLAQKARQNAIRRFGGAKAKKRVKLAYHLRFGRRLDRQSLNPSWEKPGYGISWDAHITQLQVFYYGRDLFRDIARHKQRHPRKYAVLEVGCGGGSAANDLARDPFNWFGTKVKVSATGTSRSPLWNQYKQNVDFHVAHAEQLTRVFRPRSFNFIHSNLGIGNAKDIRQAVIECHKILRKDGRLLFTSEKPVVIPEQLFRRIDYKVVPIPEHEGVGTLKVYYLQKK